MNSSVRALPTLAPGPSLVSRLLREWPGEGPIDAREIVLAHPELEVTQELTVDLAYEEYLQRSEAGEVISLADFLMQFPEVEDPLRRVLELHTLLKARPELLNGDAWPTPGETFAGLELIDELGRSAESRVYLAREPAVGGRRVVVKVTRSLRFEADALGMLEHRNIVPVLSVRTEDAGEFHALCMPFLGRVTLHDVLQARPESGDRWQPVGKKLDISWGTPGRYSDAIALIGVELAEALHFAHERGFFHCDVEPSNVLLRSDGTPMLLDFNLAVPDSQSPTFLGGTLPYMPPEMLRGLFDSPEVTPRCDVFSLGATLFHLLTGELPFGDPLAEVPVEVAARELLGRQQQGLSRSPAWKRLKRQFPEMADLLARALSYAPEQRPATAAEFAVRLRQTQQTSSRLRRWVRLHPVETFAMTVVVAIMFAVIGQWWVNRPPYVVRQYSAGLQALEAQNFEKAADHFGAVLTAVPEHRHARYLRGMASLRSEQFEQAFDDLSKVRRIEPSPALDASLGYVLCRSSRRYETAIHHLERALAGGLDTCEVNNNLGYCYYRLRKFEPARRYLERAIELSAENPTPWLNMAWVEYRDARMNLRAPDKSVIDSARQRLSTSEVAAMVACYDAVRCEFGEITQAELLKSVRRAVAAAASKSQLEEVLSSVSSGEIRAAIETARDEPVAPNKRVLEPELLLTARD